MSVREPYVLRHLGREVKVLVDDDALVVESTAGPKRIGFAEVRSVRVARLGTVEICELSLGGAAKQVISTDERECRDDYAAVVRALYERLASRGVPFVGGAWLVVAVVVVSCVVCGLLAALVVLGVIDAPAFERRATIAMVVCAVLGPVGGYAARPKPLRSAAALDAALPR